MPAANDNHLKTTFALLKAALRKLDEAETSPERRARLPSFEASNRSARPERKE